jgi:hypothetical protein
MRTLRRGAIAFKTRLVREAVSQSGLEAVNRLVREAARRSAQAADCRSARVAASPLGQEEVYRSDPAAGSGRTEIGAGDSIPGN